eukprot:280053-Pleurochrysis_carterae.AAC.1
MQSDAADWPCLWPSPLTLLRSPALPAQANASWASICDSLPAQPSQQLALEVAADRPRNRRASH